MKKVFVNEEILIKDYKEGMDLYAICEKHHIGKLKAKKILTDNGVEIRKRGGQKSEVNYMVSDFRIEKYPNEDGFHYIAKYKTSDFTTNDYMNNGGFLTSYIKKVERIEIPSLYDRREYYKKTGNYWWEQYFDIVKEKNNENVKHCPYCDWTTTDIENKSGAFLVHLLKCHHIDSRTYLKKHPEDKNYFSVEFNKIKKEEEMKDESNFVICPICKEKMSKITYWHLRYKHNMTVEKFKKKYPNVQIMSEKMIEQAHNDLSKGNLHIGKNHFISHYEREIREYLDKFGIKYESNRQILIGKEIDVLIPSKNIGIEFDGLKFHSEFFGHKSHRYHLEKTEKCEKKGVQLIHIFEDEYVNHKEIVLKKISHILGIDKDKEKVFARKMTVKEITMNASKEFLNTYHIQGFSSSTVYVGGYYNGILMCVMTFKKGNLKEKRWELTRFATNSNYRVIGAGGKLFSFFVNQYSPYKVISFADRRWTTSIKPNLYTLLGFDLEKKTAPDYKYYNEKIEKYTRFHKLRFTKQILHKKFGFPLTMTETEMTRELGYDRIWDCGLFKYVYTNEKK